MKDLSERILKFIIEYAAISPNYDETSEDLDDKYTGPDPYQLLGFVTLYEEGVIPTRVPWSDWSSGCYKPYTSKEGREEHELILKEISKVING